MDDVIIGKGSMFGKGIFAGRNFKKGEVVIRYNLTPLIEEEYKNLSKIQKPFTHTHWGKIYLYSIPERYVNDSPDPNTYQDIPHSCDIALRDIQKGESITTDASKDDVG